METTRGLLVVLLIVLASATQADTESGPATLDAQTFEALASSHIPAADDDSSIDYHYVVVAGTVEDLRFALPPSAARNLGVQAYAIATINVAELHAVPPVTGNGSYFELTLVHPQFYNGDGLAGYRAPYGGRASFDQLKVADRIVAVGVRSNDPTVQAVKFSADGNFANAFSVVCRSCPEAELVSIVTGIESHLPGLFHRGVPSTLVEPSMWDREFTEVDLSCKDAFSRLVALLSELRVNGTPGG